MLIKLKLLGSLRDRLPPGGELELPDDTTVQGLLRALDIPEKRVQVVSVNNQIEHDRQRCLNAGDKVAIMPAVVGG